MQGEINEAPNDALSTSTANGHVDEVAPTAGPHATEPVAPGEQPAQTSEQPTHPPATVAPGVAHPPRASRSLMENRLWIILGVLALTSLLLALFAAAGGSGPGGALASQQQEMVALIQKVNPSVVQIQARNSPLRAGIGSGEIVTTSGYIVTNSHVVSGFRDLTALLSDGRTASAQLIGDVPEEDLAVLKISATNLKPIALGDSNKVQVGDFALALGSPLGLEQSATTGIISALNRTGSVITNGQLVTLQGMLQTSAPINPGNSGGALVNLKGELIGIPTLGAVDPTSGASANGIGFAITSNHARDVLRRFER